MWIYYIRFLKFKLMLEFSRIYLNKSVALHAFNSFIRIVIDNVNEFSSFSDNNFLFWNATCHVIICRWCEHVIEFRWINKHFQKKHHKFLSFFAQIRILESLLLEQIIKKSDKADMFFIEQHDYFFIWLFISMIIFAWCTAADISVWRVSQWESI